MQAILDPHFLIALVVIAVWLVVLMELISRWFLIPQTADLFGKTDPAGKSTATLDVSQIVTTIVAISGLFTTALGFIWGYYFSQKSQSSAADIAGAAHDIVQQANTQTTQIALGKQVAALGTEGIDQVIGAARSRQALTDDQVRSAQRLSDLFDPSVTAPNERAIAQLKNIRDQLEQ
jgi:hypothetical protein